MRNACRGAAALLLACVMTQAATASVAAAAGELKPGDVLGPDNYQAAEGLLPPEILKHYQTGDYKNVIVDYPVGNSKWEPAWKDATEKNAGQLDVDDVGTVIFKGSGKQPDYLYGFPFPNIDPNDPKAAVKVVWNQFLSYWSGGSSFNVARVTMLQPKGIDRDIHADGYFNFWDGQAEKYRKPNPNNLQSQFLGVTTFPTDLQGTSSLSWRYRDANKRDSVWAFVPALRRVRAVSPANRSDGYLGSDISGDDGFFFDGKPEDFEWKLIGKRDALRVGRSQQREGQPQDPARPGRRLRGADLGQPAHGRFPGSELDRPLVGADQRRPRSAAGVGGRGDAQGSLLPVRQDPAVDRRRDLGRLLEHQVQLAGRRRALLPDHGARQSAGRERRDHARLHPGVGLRRELQDEPRHPRRHARRPQGPLRPPHPDRLEHLRLAGAGEVREVRTA
jgi:hypothetical protein